MAGAAPARALTRPAPVPAGRFEIGLATPADDAAIRALLREHPLPGDIAISFEREPDAGLAAAIEGDPHQTIVAREAATGRIAAIAGRSVHQAFVNGEPARIGYLGQLRIARPFRVSRTLMDAGYAFCRALHDADPVPFYLTSILSGNTSARRLLLDLLSKHAPRMRPVARLVTVVARPSRLPRVDVPAGIRIERGGPGLLDEIVGCLERNGRRHQFARRWTSSDFSSVSTRGLSLTDFVVALQRDRVIGCLACWDQRAFKQAVVRGYSPWLHRWRWLVNVTGPLTGVPALPAPGRRLELAYLSHVAVDADRADVFLPLLGAARALVPRGVDHVVTGFGQASPLLGAIRSTVRHRAYESVLFVASWADGDRAVPRLDGRVPHPEIAVL